MFAVLLFICHYIEGWRIYFEADAFVDLRERENTRDILLRILAQKLHLRFVVVEDDLRRVWRTADLTAEETGEIAAERPGFTGMPECSWNIRECVKYRPGKLKQLRSNFGDIAGT